MFNHIVWNLTEVHIYFIVCQRFASIDPYTFVAILALHPCAFGIGLIYRQFHNQNIYDKKNNIKDFMLETNIRHTCHYISKFKRPRNVQRS